MKKNKGCFKVDSKTLSLDHVLACYFGTPILFVCKDNDGNYYLVDREELCEGYFLIGKIELSVLSAMFHQKISIGDALLSQGFCWIVKDKGDLLMSPAERRLKKDIDEYLLPSADLYFVFFTKENALYRAKIDNLLL